MKKTSAEVVPPRAAPSGFRPVRAFAASPLLMAALLALPAHADTEVTTAEGRRVILKDDGTWSYQDDKDKDNKDKAKPEYNPKQDGEAVLRLERKVDRGTVCGVVLSLQNQLTYEIVNVIPYLAAYRANGVVFQTVSVPFQSIRPSGVQTSTAEFSGIACSEIGRIQVSGGDRCEMGELNKFSDVKGQCLARIRVVASDLVRFDK